MTKICDECECVAHCTKNGCVPKAPVTGWPASELAQDNCRGLSKALSNTPHARLNATEAAAAVSAQLPGPAQTSGAQNPKFTMDEWQAHARKHRWRFDVETPEGPASPAQFGAAQDEPVADWNNRSTTTFSGWINELLTLADHSNRTMPTWARAAIKTIANGLRAAAPPAPAVQEGWQSIETAPKDGTLVMLGARNGVWPGKYEPVYTSGYRPEDPWASMLMNHDHMAERYTRPTHWMPLPAAPTAEMQAAGAAK